MDQNFLTAVWKWIEACEASSAAGEAGSAKVEWEAVKVAAEEAGIAPANLMKQVGRAMNFKFPGGSFRAWLAAIEANFGGGAAGGGATAGTISASGLLVGAAVCVVVAVAALGCYVMVANARDARNARMDSAWLYQQYLLRFQKFQLAQLARSPRMAPYPPLTFDEWLANQGSKITVL
jgi:hypothetical protein